jgi:hypothetical protein
MLIFLGGPLPENAVYVYTKKSFETLLQNLDRGSDAWIVCPMPDSVENRVLQEMVKDSLWEGKVVIEEAPTFKEYNALVKSYGLKIVHTEIQRKFINRVPLEWIKEIGLDPDEEASFKKDFIQRLQASDHLAKRMLIHIVN